MLLGDLLFRAAENHPDKPALIFPRERLTFSELEEQSRRVANGLRELGIGPGQRVGILYENSPAALIFFWGILRSGAEVVDLPALSGLDVIDQILAEAQPAALALFCAP
jgi:long-chain acyl-CoA synthetase